jgi:hypothetical protein
MTSSKWAIAILVLAACGDNLRLATDAGPGDGPGDSPMVDANPLDTLDGTGLCLDAGCTQISPDVHEYAPRFVLWADTATKRRWMQLPPGTQIDTTDMNRWVFPVGTKFWKEFTRDGTRVETRFITKRLADDDAPGAWFFITYKWNAPQDATTAVINGEQNVNGTMHDIPSRAGCRECHESLRPSRVLGFQAIQLDYSAPNGLLDLNDLIAQSLLTTNPGGGATHFPLPGNAVDQAALGYMHANCGHCHNPQSPVHDMTPVELLLDITKLATVTGTPTYTTSVDVDAAIPFTDPPGGMTFTKIIISADPAGSGLFQRMKTTTATRHMPRLGTEITDPDGLAAVQAWINTLP